VTVVRSLLARLLPRRTGTSAMLDRHLATGEPELHLLPILCDPERAFLDVGANMGVYSLLAAPHSRCVYALEANPELAGRLRDVLGDRHTVLDVGASDHEATAVLHIPVRAGADVHWRSSVEPDANPGFDSRDVTVRLTPIDALDLPPVGVVKIDVEGHELAVLRGARRLLGTDRPAVIVESEERHHAGGVEQVRRFLTDLGYEGHYLHRGAMRPVDTFDAARLQPAEEQKAVGAGRSPDYVNNFVYLHAEDPRRPRVVAYRPAAGAEGGQDTSTRDASSGPSR
jgi:FkbM family methyltransferase